MSDESALTGTELAVLEWLRAQCGDKVYPQWHSLRRIAQDVNHSPSTVLRTVHALQTAGFITITQGPGGAYGYEVNT